MESLLAYPAFKSLDALFTAVNGGKIEAVDCNDPSKPFSTGLAAEQIEKRWIHQVQQVYSYPDMLYEMKLLTVALRPSGLTYVYAILDPTRQQWRHLSLEWFPLYDAKACMESAAANGGEPLGGTGRLAGAYDVIGDATAGAFIGKGRRVSWVQDGSFFMANIPDFISDSELERLCALIKTARE